MTFSRRALAVAVLAFLAFVVSVVMLGLDIARYHKAHPPVNWAFAEVTTRTFQYAGRDVALEDVKKGDVPYLRVRYGIETLDLPVTIPGDFQNLPGLASHSDWLRVLRFADASGLTFPDLQKKIDAGEVRDRLVIVTKIPRPGADTRTWGEVWKRDWQFGLYELLPDGTIRRQVLRYPTSKMGQPPKEGELLEGSWEFQAALHLMPKEGPTLRFRTSALSEITWPMRFAVASLIVCFIAIVAGFRRRPDAAPSPAP